MSIPEMVGCVVMSSPEERQSWLDDVACTVALHFPAQAGGQRAFTR
ncbi:MAG: hypothetical protein J7M39_09360 [Anaerolineae bacterium]|nr:hypothetical protein [Anaerolineae bacterium]